MTKVQQENNSDKHLANSKYKYRQEEKTARLNVIFRFLFQDQT